MATTNVGKAARVTAAAQVGPRYDGSLTPEQRSDIDNGIWLCANHADLIDRDTATYTVEVLRRMRLDRDAACKAGVISATGRVGRALDLLAIGPDIAHSGSLPNDVAYAMWDY